MISNNKISNELKKIIKDNFIEWQNAGGEDTLKALGRQSKKEYNYYINL